MKITRIDTWWESIPLRRPYRIAYHDTDHVELGFVRIVIANGSEGFGCAAPVEEITGESIESCRAALDTYSRLPEEDGSLFPRLERDYGSTPAACAAVDSAAHDVSSRTEGLPLLDSLGCAQMPLSTSVTIGILPLDETLAEAEEHRAAGFRILKVKVGEDVDHDVERLARVRERVGRDVLLRADANVGYDVSAVERFFALTERIGIEFLEQPTPRALDDELRRLPFSIQQRLAADESLFDFADAVRLARDPCPFGIWNIKLAKCGGIAPAWRIAELAQTRGIAIMWGCMDESVVGIAAALNLAYACKATRYLDLDGSFDLARDPFRGGFELRDGRLHTLRKPGLGVERNT